MADSRGGDQRRRGGHGCRCSRGGVWEVNKGAIRGCFGGERRYNLELFWR